MESIPLFTIGENATKYTYQVKTFYAGQEGEPVRNEPVDFGGFSVSTLSRNIGLNESVLFILIHSVQMNSVGINSSLELLPLVFDAEDCLPHYHPQIAEHKNITVHFRKPSFENIYRQQCPDV